MNYKEAKEYCEEMMYEDLKVLGPKERLNFYLSLLEYFVPKQNRINFEQDEKIDKIQIVDATASDKSI